jgi:Uncharacterized alpha/beta hydrolase domain (DUF2235)
MANRYNSPPPIPGTGYGGNPNAPYNASSGPPPSHTPDPRYNNPTPPKSSYNNPNPGYHSPAPPRTPYNSSPLNPNTAGANVPDPRYNAGPSKPNSSSTRPPVPNGLAPDSRYNGGSSPNYNRRSDGAPEPVYNGTANAPYPSGGNPPYNTGGPAGYNPGGPVGGPGYDPGRLTPNPPFIANVGPGYNGRLTPMPNGNPDPRSGYHQKKRIIVCCDGTWMNSDNGYDPTTKALQIPTNVTRIVRCIHTEAWPKHSRGGGPGSSGPGGSGQSQNNIPQITYYQAGVGSGSSLYDKVVGGATGAGLGEHIREAYAFIADNYCRGDHIYLIGFSRGAYTARSISGLIEAVGLLTKIGMEDFYPIFKDYQNRYNRHYHDLFPNQPFSHKPSFTRKGGWSKYISRLRRTHGPNGEPEYLTRSHVQIEVVAVWDTVGSLGIPQISLLERLPFNVPSNKEMRFYDTKLSGNVRYAFQALALDEMRFSFSPAIWEKPKGSRTVRLSHFSADSTES